MEQLLGQQHAAAAAHGAEPGPGGIVLKGLSHKRQGAVLRPHGGDEDEVRVGGDDRFHAHVLQHALVAVRQVVRSQIPQDHSGQIVVPLGLGPGGVGPDQQGCGARLVLRCRQHSVDLSLHREAVLLIQVLPACQAAELLQHGQVVREGVHPVVGVGDLRRRQRVVKLYLAGHVRGEDHKVRGQGQDLLQAGLLHRAHHGHVLPQLQPPLTDGVLCGPRQSAPGQEPCLGKAAVEGGHPVPALQNHLMAQGVGKGNGRGRRSRLRRGAAVRRGRGGAAHQEDRRQSRPQDLFHASHVHSHSFTPVYKYTKNGCWKRPSMVN